MTPRQVFERAHEFVRAYDIAYVDCFAEDGVLVLPFAPPGMPRRFEGRGAIRQLLEPRYRTAREAGERIGTYRNLHIHDTADPEVIVAEFEAIGLAADGSERYDRPFIQVVRVRDGEIVEQRDYFDSLAMVERLRPRAAQHC
jgi:ketosteroid isomerase-like protein